MSSNTPTETGFYLARRHDWFNTIAPVVVRVTVDPGLVPTVWLIGSRDPSLIGDWHFIAKIRIDGSVKALDLDRLQKEAHADGVKQGREQAHREQIEYEANRDRAHPTFPAWTGDPEFRETGEPIIAIHMRAQHAETLSNQMSDLLCWARGFKAALGSEDYDRAPMGIDAVRTIRETITKAQRAAEGAKS